MIKTKVLSVVTQKVWGKSIKINNLKLIGR